jgi:hypothetical protein
METKVTGSGPMAIVRGQDSSWTVTPEEEEEEEEDGIQILWRIDPLLGKALETNNEICSGAVNRLLQQ